MHWFNYLAGNPADGSKPQVRKLIISDEYYQRVTSALIMRLRQHEEAVVQGGHLKLLLFIIELLFFWKAKEILLIIQFQASTRSANWNKNKLQPWGLYCPSHLQKSTDIHNKPHPLPKPFVLTPLHFNTCLNISPPNIQWQQSYIWNNPKQHMHPSQIASDAFPNELNPETFTSPPHTCCWFLSQNIRLILFSSHDSQVFQQSHLAHIFIIFRKHNWALVFNCLVFHMSTTSTFCFPPQFIGP